MGSLSNIQAKELAITAGKAAIERAGISPELIDEITMGQVYPLICRVHYLPDRLVWL